MGMPRKPDPEKYCAWCGKRMTRKRLRNGDLQSLLHFEQQKYCDRECMRRGFLHIGQSTGKWDAAHTSAQNINKLLLERKICEICGKSGTLDVYHMDGDWQNNEIDNLQVLCRSCHNATHGRGSKCIVCGLPVKGHGYCEKHYQRFKRYGDPLQVRVAAKCSMCGEKAQSHGLCGKHYMQAKRAGTLDEHTAIKSYERVE